MPADVVLSGALFAFQRSLIDFPLPGLADSGVAEMTLLSTEFLVPQKFAMRNRAADFR